MQSEWDIVYVSTYQHRTSATVCTASSVTTSTVLLWCHCTNRMHVVHGSLFLPLSSLLLAPCVSLCLPLSPCVSLCLPVSPSLLRPSLSTSVLLRPLFYFRAFPVSEFRGAVSSDKMAEKVGSVFSMKDVVKDAKDSFSARGVTPIEGFRGAALLSEDQRIPGQQSQLSVQPFGQDFEQI